MKIFSRLIFISILLFACIPSASSTGEIPHRLLYVNEWGGITNSRTSIDLIINDAAYTNVDAIMIELGNEYFEAARDPINKGSWDSRASWNMLEYFITKAHEKNIKVHAWLSANGLGGTLSAYYKLFGPSSNYPYNQVNQNGIKDTALPYRLDLTFKGLQDYDIDLFTWMSKHYPTLDGLHIEEPVYLKYSYSTAVRDRVKIKFGYDPMYPPSGMTISKIQADITNVQRDGLNEFFTRLRSSINANKANPNFLISANSWVIGYMPGNADGLDVQYLANNHLIDFYAQQASGETLDIFWDKANYLSKYITEIPVISVVYFYYHSSIGDKINPAFFDEVTNGCKYGVDGLGIYEWHWYKDYTGGYLNGQNIRDTLHNIPSSSCGGLTTAAPTPVITAIPTVAPTPAITAIPTVAPTPAITAIPTASPTPLIVSPSTNVREPSFTAISSNIILNPGFESGTTSWLFYTNGAGIFNIVSSGYDGINSAKLGLFSSGTNIQLYQTGLTLEPYTNYRLKFDAYSTTGHDLTVNLLKHDSPYTKYGLSFTPDLGMGWKTFTTEFSTSGFSGTVKDGRLMFFIGDLAAAGDIYYIDDVRLEKVAPPMVIGNSPKGTNVSVSARITVNFSELMNQSSVQSSFSTIPETTGTFSWSGNNMTYTPGNFLYNTVYNVTIGADVMDISGDNMLSSYNWEFITELSPPNSISNPGFESGKESWTFYTGSSGTFSISSPGYEGNNASKLVLNSQSTNIQLYQAGVTLEPNSLYRLSFAAYSTTGHDLTVNLIRHDSPYTKYGLSFIPDLGMSWKTFTTEFNTTGFSNTVKDGRLIFQLSQFANAGDIYYIDDVRLEMIDAGNMI